jgi:hypothetical protein
MRKVILALIAAGSAVAVAAPASAQYYQQPYGYNGYGYNNGSGYSGYYNRDQMQNELRHIRIEADNLGRQGRLTRSEARDLYSDIASAERSLYRTNNPWQARNVSEKISRIRYELRRYSDYDYNRYGRYGRYSGYGNNGYYDRDHDGRDDRYENDHGWNHDD